MVGSVLDGVFAINKPLGMSSAQVIRDVQQHFNPSTLFKPMIDQERANKAHEKKKRRRFKDEIRVKMGHGGTLDPLATGVLILGVGKGTKSLQAFLDCTKTYETVVLFGASTDTYDRVGRVLKKTAYDHITRPMVEEALNSFRGKLQQVPPLYSALKMEGKPLYEYAREGKPIPREIATREVNVTEMKLVEWYDAGTHNHRWPVEEATTFERSFAEQVWKIEKDQVTNKKKLTPEEEVEETKALQEHEKFKRKADESVDALIYDKVNKRRRANDNSTPALMSGALGEAPPPRAGKGSNLIPPPHDPNTPPPWDDKGPAAARIRMTVTSGFYVRSFCHDLGVKVGSAGMMAELCRSRQGDFELGSSNCLEFSDLAEGEEKWAPQVESMLAQWNDKSHSASSSAPARAVPVQSPVHAQKSVEDSPSGKRKSPESFDEQKASPSESNSPSSSRDRNHNPPEVESASAEAKVEHVKEENAPLSASKAVEAGEKDEAMSQPIPDPAIGMPKSSNIEEEEWNGIEDTPASKKQSA